MAAKQPSVSERKRAAIMAAAREVFITVGYANASMDGIAAAADVSKQTVYNHFGSKEDLFASIIQSSCGQLMQPLHDADAASGPPEPVLRRLAHMYLDMMQLSKRAHFYRTMLVEAHRVPELARIYYESGPGLAVTVLADYFERQTRRGVLKVENPRVVAEQFFGMLNGHLLLRAVLGIEPKPAPEKVQAYIDNAVKTLVNVTRA